ncbi:MAG: hypothetical protein MUO41_00530, partial [Methyloceanibacter sp.]|nr:hypothetical protein [Methyloceanibacter sp.]
VLRRCNGAGLALFAKNWNHLRIGKQTRSSDRLEDSVFLHLANAHQSVAENVRLQERAASLVDAAGIQKVIVPMSTSTIEAVGPDGPRFDAENLGFSYSGIDP